MANDGIVINLSVTEQTIVITVDRHVNQHSMEFAECVQMLRFELEP